MAYIDYSAQFILDQFFTYINANQLGSNDAHLAASLDVEHNWNIATVDGTHDWATIAIPRSTDVKNILAGASWTPDAGLYQLITTSIDNDQVKIQLYITSVWLTSSFTVLGGLYFFDGTNMKFGNSHPTDTGYVGYQKF